MRKTLVALVFAAACSGGSSQAPPPNPGTPGPLPPMGSATGSAAGSSTEPGSGTGSSATTPDSGSATGQGGGGPGLHEKCGPNDSCGVGECVTYFGIAGPRGPQFKTCEIKCDATTKCPAGTSCGVIADGPGQVCR
jgi:hypothetical protein